jgi:nitric oxide reductase subunit B
MLLVETQPICATSTLPKRLAILRRYLRAGLGRHRDLPDRTADSQTSRQHRGKVLFSEGQVQRGQEAWLSAGGQQLGSVWGHGSYVAPDWSADWLHREALALRDLGTSVISATALNALSVEPAGGTQCRLKTEMRRNTYDAATGTITLSPERAEAVQQVVQHYTACLAHDPSLDALREQYAMSAGSLPDPLDLQALPAFIFWSSLVRGHRPARRNGSELHQQLAPRAAGGQYAHRRAGIWSIASIIFMIAAIAGMIVLTIRRTKKKATPSRPRPTRCLT